MRFTFYPFASSAAAEIGAMLMVGWLLTRKFF
jgi:hypothetical protein